MCSLLTEKENDKFKPNYFVLIAREMTLEHILCNISHLALKDLQVHMQQHVSSTTSLRIKKKLKHFVFRTDLSFRTSLQIMIISVKIFKEKVN